MKKSTIILITTLIIVGACDNLSVQNSSDQVSTGNKKVKIVLNEAGDTVRINYRDDGSMQSKVTVKNRYKNGLAYNYYPNGNVQFELNYKDGFKSGMAKYFYESGKIYRETPYLDDQIDGVQKFYFESGELNAEVPYKKGEIIMGTKEYLKSGKLITDYPKIKVVAVDNLVVDNKYYLQISLEPDKSKTEFYIHVKHDKFEGKQYLTDYEKNGIINYPIYLSPGESRMEKLDIRAVTKTGRGNPIVLSKIYNLAIENRNYYK